MPERFEGFPEAGMGFLADLTTHNRRTWFNQRKDVYLESVKAPMEKLILALSADLARFAPEIVATPKVSAYRIYRDTRFSDNKTPYKTHAAAVFPPRGLRKHQGAAFYLQVSPGETFAGGGLYMPAGPDLVALREHIAANHTELRRILASRKFRRFFGEVHGESLVRVPRGFPRDHPAEDLLRRKQFLASASLDPGVVTTREFQPALVETFRALHPLIAFLNRPILEANGVRNATLGTSTSGS